MKVYREESISERREDEDICVGPKRCPTTDIVTLTSVTQVDVRWRCFERRYLGTRSASGLGLRWKF